MVADGVRSSAWAEMVYSARFVVVRAHGRYWVALDQGWIADVQSDL